MLQRITRRAATLSVVLALATRAHAAQGLNLAWNHCLGEGTGVQNETFACDSNAGSHTMTGSFVLSRDMVLVVGCEIVLQLASASPTLPAWWRFRNAGTCRRSSLTVNLAPEPENAVCADWSEGQMAGGLASYCTIAGECADHPSGANEARIKIAEAVAESDAKTLAGGVEYFAFNIVLDHARTVGAGACAGCQTPVCIVLNSINVVARGNVEMRFLSTPLAPASNAITWQGGGVPVTSSGSGCPAATPARTSSWGRLKATYR